VNSRRPSQRDFRPPTLGFKVEEKEAFSEAANEKKRGISSEIGFDLPFLAGSEKRASQELIRKGQKEGGKTGRGVGCRTQGGGLASRHVILNAKGVAA